MGDYLKPKKHGNNYEVVLSGNIERLRELKVNYANNQEVLKYLEMRIATLEKVKKIEIEKKYWLENKKVEIETDEANFTILKDIALPRRQSTSNGCWSCTSQLLLQSRGVNLEQEEIRAYRPDMTTEDIKRVVRGDYGSDSVLKEHTQNKISTPLSVPWLFSATCPNTVMKSANFKPFSESDKPVAEKMEQERNAIFSFIKDAIDKHHSPASLLVPGFSGHWMTITGYNEKTREVMVVNSLGKGSPVQPRKMSIDSLITNSKKPYQLVWLEDLNVNKGSIYNIPSEVSTTLYYDAKGNLVHDNEIPNVVEDAVVMDDPMLETEKNISYSNQGLQGNPYPDLDIGYQVAIPPKVYGKELESYKEFANQHKKVAEENNVMKNCRMVMQRVNEDERISIPVQKDVVPELKALAILFESSLKALAGTEGIFTGGTERYSNMKTCLQAFINTAGESEKNVDKDVYQRSMDKMLDLESAVKAYIAYKTNARKGLVGNTRLNEAKELERNIESVKEIFATSYLRHKSKIKEYNNIREVEEGLKKGQIEKDSTFVKLDEGLIKARELNHKDLNTNLLKLKEKFQEVEAVWKDAFASDKNAKSLFDDLKYSFSNVKDDSDSQMLHKVINWIAKDSKSLLEFEHLLPEDNRQFLHKFADECVLVVTDQNQVKRQLYEKLQKDIVKYYKEIDESTKQCLSSKEHMDRQGNSLEDIKVRYIQLSARCAEWTKGVSMDFLKGYLATPNMSFMPWEKYCEKTVDAMQKPIAGDDANIPNANRDNKQNKEKSKEVNHDLLMK